MILFFTSSIFSLLSKTIFLINTKLCLHQKHCTENHFIADIVSLSGTWCYITCKFSTSVEIYQSSLCGYMLKLVEISVLLLFQSCLNERVEISTRVFFVRFLPSLLNYMPSAPSRLTCLRAFVHYLPHALLGLFALQVFEPYVPSFLTFLCVSS